MKWASLLIIILLLLSFRNKLTVFIRNLLKGKVTSGPVGKQETWKKDGDPALKSDADPFWLKIDQLKWSFMSNFGRLVTPLVYPHPHLNFYDVKKYPGVKGLVAVTVDDCFCRQTEEHSLCGPYRQLFKKYNARATFFLTLQYSEGEWREREIAAFIAEGHELANHCKEDREYDCDTAESFERDLDATDSFIRRVTKSDDRCKWFRAPSGNVSPEMEKVLAKKGMVNVMLDCYANDPHIPDEEFIASTMCKRVTDGSIMVIHMPEKGFREWDFRAMELILEELQKKGLRSVTLTELESAASGTTQTS